MWNKNTSSILWEFPEYLQVMISLLVFIGRGSIEFGPWLTGPKQNLSYDTSSPIPKLKTPHYTERVGLKEPLEFPCKVNYEKINVTIDGLKEKNVLMEVLTTSHFQNLKSEMMMMMMMMMMMVEMIKMVMVMMDLMEVEEEQLILPYLVRSRRWKEKVRKM